MANRKQFNILQQGVDTWNLWREKHPKEFINLRNANLQGMDLCEINLQYADLRGTSFKKSILVGANLTNIRAGVHPIIVVIRLIFSVLSGGLLAWLSSFAGFWIAFQTTWIFIEIFLKGFRVSSFDLNKFIILVGLFSLLFIGTVVAYIRIGRIGLWIGAFIVAIMVAWPTVYIIGGSGFTSLPWMGQWIALLTTVAITTGVAILAMVIVIIILVISVIAGIWNMFGIVVGGLLVAMNWPLNVGVIPDEIGVIALSCTIDILVIACYITWRVFHEDPQFVFFRRLGIIVASCGGTSFQQAALRNVNFSSADLKNTCFTNAMINQTCWYESKNLQVAQVKETILSDKAIRELLVTGDGEYQSFIGKNLRGAHLAGARLDHADFTQADLHEATLQGADISFANLKEAILLGTNCQSANFTGAYLEAWNIDSTTNLNNVQCEYVYLRSNPTERRPNSGNFSVGEFSKLFQEVLTTIDFIFQNGIDWQAFLLTFENIRHEVHSENEGTDIAVQSIENKGDGVFVVKAMVSEEIDKEKLHHEFKEQYTQQLAIQEAKYQALLQGKDELVTLYKQQSIYMKEIIHALAQKQIFNITGEKIAMSEKYIGRDNIEIGGNAHVEQFTTGAGDTFQGDYAQKLLQSTTPESSQENIVGSSTIAMENMSCSFTRVDNRVNSKL